MKTARPTPSRKWLDRKPFSFDWTFPAGDAGTKIRHGARKCEVIVRDKDGKIKRDDRGRAVRKLVTVRAYTQVVR